LKREGFGGRDRGRVDNALKLARRKKPLVKKRREETEAIIRYRELGNGGPLSGGRRD